MEQNLETQMPTISETDSKITIGQKLINVLRSVQRKLSEPGSEGDNDYERRITEIQRKVYGMEKKHWWQHFTYDMAELDPTYDSEVLEPFLEKLRQRGQIPRVLDLGAGKGETSVYMDTRGVKTIKVDISNIGLRGQESAVQASAWHLPFPDGSFDGIHSKDMVTHIPLKLRDRFFSELHRVMKPEGVILLCSAEEANAGNMQYLTFKESLIKIGEKNGFRVENTKDWKPASGFKDWYMDRRRRFVLELKKYKSRAQKITEARRVGAPRSLI